MAKGERLLKDLCKIVILSRFVCCHLANPKSITIPDEALRAGPGWENTLFFVAYDDAGGFCESTIAVTYS